MFFQVLHVEHGVNPSPISSQLWRREITVKCFVSVTGLTFTYQHNYLDLLPLSAEENKK